MEYPEGKEVRERTGRETDAEKIRRHMAAANIITTFVFWHEFLHGNDEGRVRGIYDRMAKDYRKWSNTANGTLRRGT